jgi:hypothetical protein
MCRNQHHAVNVITDCIPRFLNKKKENDSIRCRCFIAITFPDKIASLTSSKEKGFSRAATYCGDSFLNNRFEHDGLILFS